MDPFSIIIYISYGGDGFDSFKIPNHKKRSPMGFDSGDPKYAMGETGGEDFVTLKLSQSPKHDHVYSDDTNALGKFPNVAAGFPQSVGYVNETKSSGSNSGTGTAYYTSKTGGLEDGSTEPHENRHPFIVEARIIKVK